MTDIAYKVLQSDNEELEKRIREYENKGCCQVNSDINIKLRDKIKDLGELVKNQANAIAGYLKEIRQLKDRLNK